MTPQVLVIEGCDGVGKSHHADRLAAALRAKGVDAVAFHHAKPADADPVLAALDYAAQRRRLVRNPPAAVIVADRWWHSTWVLGTVLRGHLRDLAGVGLRNASDAEWSWHPEPWVAVLDAPDAVLDARLASRGAPPTDMERAMRWPYRHGVVEHLRLDTSRPADVVAAELLAWARGVLR